MLELERIVAGYGAGGRAQVVLRDVSLRVGPGEVVVVVGASGTGKSTLLDIAAGLRAPEAGITRLDGREVSATTLRAATGYMRQRDLLVPWRTALDNAALLLEAGGMGRREARALAAARFPDAGLAGSEGRYPRALSGGMRQRVAFVRTMLPGRRWLLLDEPFGALDAITRAEMQGWLAAWLARHEVGVLLVTHDVEEAIVLGDRVLVLGGAPATVVHEERIVLASGNRAGQTTTAPFIAHKASLLAALGRAMEGRA